MSATDAAAASRVHAFRDDALGEDDAVGLAVRLKAGSVSASDLVEASIARAERVEPDLNALAHQAFDRARTEARSPRAGWFSGIPTFVKDNSDVEGMPSQHGSTSWRARPAKADGDWARMYRGTGVVPLGKTQLSEFGFSASAEFPAGSGLEPVRNPWHTAYTSGASSAGSAAFVGAGVVPLAHANDGGGSIRIPASCCGLVGLKPTRGRTPSDKASQAMPVRIVVDGVLTRSVRDTAAFYREAEKIYRDLALPPIGDIRRPGRKRLRIGLVTASVAGRTTAPETLVAVEDVARLLEGEGHHVEPAAPPAPDQLADDFALYWGLLAAMITDTGRVSIDRRFDKSATDNLTRGLARAAHRGMFGLPGAISRLKAAQRLSRQYFAQTAYDVVLSPVLAHPAPRVGHLSPDQDYDTVFSRLLDWVTFTPWQNVSGDPAISLPAAISADSTPVGVMVSAPFGGEATLIELAYEIEAARPFARIQD